MKPCPLLCDDSPDKCFPMETALTASQICKLFKYRSAAGGNGQKSAKQIEGESQLLADLQTVRKRSTDISHLHMEPQTHTVNMTLHVFVVVKLVAFVKPYTYLQISL